jgi:hypothetical protein
MALGNPFAKGSEDLRGQTILLQRDPKLAEHYRNMAEKPMVNSRSCRTKKPSGVR